MSLFRLARIGVKGEGLCGGCPADRPDQGKVLPLIDAQGFDGDSLRTLLEKGAQP